MSKVLGVDHGRKRIGVAVSDLGRKVALPLEVVDGRDRFKILNRFKALVEEHDVSEVVLGHPLNMMGQSGQQAEKVEAFAERLKHKLGSEVSVVLWDERLSSVQADRGRLGKKSDASAGTRDIMAAVVILQSYLDSRS